MTQARSSLHATGSQACLFGQWRSSEDDLIYGDLHQMCSSIADLCRLQSDNIGTHRPALYSTFLSPSSRRCVDIAVSKVEASHTRNATPFATAYCYMD